MRGLHGFHRIHIPPVTCWSSENSSDADRSSTFTNDNDVFVFFLASIPTHVANTQRSFKDNFFWDLRHLKGLAITCSPISRTALAPFLPYNLKHAVRPSFPTCPRLGNSPPASSVIHSMIFKSDSTLHNLHRPYLSHVVLNCSFCRSVRLWSYAGACWIMEGVLLGQVHCCAPLQELHTLVLSVLAHRKCSKSSPCLCLFLCPCPYSFLC